MLKPVVLRLSVLAALSGCISLDYSDLKPGTFSGSLFVMWVGEGSASSGDGRFVFVPDPKDPLTFRRSDSGAPGAVIRPGLMYTDGGSIPKVAQMFKGLSPWGYAPAYMIHDWLFTAHHCILDGEDDARFDDVRHVTFRDSAVVLGEAIRGLVEAGSVRRDDIAGSAITAAVNSAVAKNLWDIRGACVRNKVSADHVAAVEAAIPGSSTLSMGRAFKLPPSTQRIAPRERASIVSRTTF
ncbi:DUF1353 domain-containing protein [Sinorhizobium numidicum]|uniref:DUF1353 domain-containing protein n=1 Tax=Sinorhizobium numidicum TaxID=680248 RepID=A0ABY8CZR1_9HYPH|nr:hypothetical protein [Sinorhizobium numidicum]WEX76106.1 DUF1353 domain-containing protein [Sinorhizobium numidicum]WEX82765.1 DUF1353 domain-containing protein [Sinorhizobium numidicum]